MKLTFKPCLNEQDTSNFREILEDIKQNKSLYCDLGFKFRIYRNFITCFGRDSINIFITMLLLKGVRFYV